MKYRIIVSLILVALLVFAFIINSDHTEGAVPPDAAPAASQPNFNL